ncbi:hypothetical protein CDL12_26145 [Handroanthus impetiginosus]|uniref:Uncharacterized protein n=1 Tax=Handroanthus impetiginosus TaxID=429701 RepID=A0A2G9G7T0_9LAMI|nr:hypothetical protein CDL12_26145 [Handroanthus impetiginosus]
MGREMLLLHEQVAFRPVKASFVKGDVQSGLPGLFLCRDLVSGFFFSFFDSFKSNLGWDNHCLL